MSESIRQPALTLRLTRAEADALHTLLSIVLNDPDWFDGEPAECRAVSRVSDKLVRARRRGDSMIRPTFQRLPDPSPGVREYAVVVCGERIGVVANRPGGWWRASYSDEGGIRGSFHPTRREAVRALQHYGH